MNNPKLATDEPSSPAVRSGRSHAFDALSQILLVLMGASLVFFGLLMVPPELDSVIDEILGWCVAAVSVLVAVIVAVGLVERLTD
jgi:hypothetical protein